MLLCSVWSGMKLLSPGAPLLLILTVSMQWCGRRLCSLLCAFLLLPQCLICCVLYGVTNQPIWLLARRLLLL